MAVSSSPRKAAHRNTRLVPQHPRQPRRSTCRSGPGRRPGPEPPPARSARGCRKRRPNSGRPTPITSARPSARSPSSCWTPPLKSAAPALAVERMRNSPGSLPGIRSSIAQLSRRDRAVRYGLRLSHSTANLEAAPTRNHSLNKRHGSSILVELAPAGLTCCR
jgi:hypothetical protein